MTTSTTTTTPTAADHDRIARLWMLEGQDAEAAGRMDTAEWCYATARYHTEAALACIPTPRVPMSAAHAAEAARIARAEGAMR